MTQNGKYLWLEMCFDNWIIKEQQQFKDIGLNNMSKKSITKLLVDHVLIPNDIHLIDLIKKKLEVKGWKKNGAK